MPARVRYGGGEGEGCMDKHILTRNLNPGHSTGSSMKQLYWRIYLKKTLQLPLNCLATFNFLSKLALNLGYLVWNICSLFQE